MDIEKYRAELIRENERIARVEAREIETVKKKYDSERSLAHNNYLSGANSDLIRILKEDYAILQDRTLYSNVPEDERVRIREAYKALENIQDESTRKTILTVITAFLPKEKVEEILALREAKHIQKKEITSYLSDNSNDTCYVLTPINGENNRDLARNLEIKLEGVFSEGRVITGFGDYSATKAGIERLKTSEIEFESDKNLVNGFLMYTLLTQKHFSNELAKQILRKLNNSEMQPAGFRESKLIHVVQTLPSDILDYFINYEISPEQYVKEGKIRGKRRMGLAFSSTEPDGRRREALERVRKLGEECSVNDAQRVLGLKSNEIYKIVANFENTASGIGRGKRERIIVATKDLMQFINTHTPYEAHWKKE